MTYDKKIPTFTSLPKLPSPQPKMKDAMETGDDRDHHDLEPNPAPNPSNSDGGSTYPKKNWYHGEDPEPKNFTELSYSKLQKLFRSETGTGRWSLEINVSREKSRDVNMLTKWTKAFEYVMEIPGVELTIHPYSLGLPNITTTAGLPSDEATLKKYAMEDKIRSRGVVYAVRYVMNVTCNRSLADVKRQHSDLTTRLGAINVFIEQHPFKTITLREIGLFPYLHPRMTNIGQLEMRLQRILKGALKVEVPFIVFRKTQRFGDTDVIRAPILAIKCEEENVVTLKDALLKVAGRGILGSRYKFLPHGIIYELGRNRYRNILNQHIKYTNQLVAVQVYEVEDRALRRTLTLPYNVDGKEATILDRLQTTFEVTRKF